ncbi:membrane protein DedA with SNARE-associated domain [Palleronia aestuarii]|uniref:Membrane protein DedA with SNARE-associated domain n=1 Tax=Palleronia aestuarii TaxID=568105 RepID=A0A2W7N5F0_9RHOB|nr:DedA family protein [Palleronia aestuarii]PZX15290.1 membrane protein DedA with SNARE-associated domain [Palleronia aestuarii]
MQLEAFLSDYGLWALGIGAALEGETVTVLGGMMAHRGLFAYLPAVLAAAAGSFASDQTFFMIGRRYRDTGYVQKVRSRPAFQRALATFERHPTAFVFLSRFLYGLRTISPLAIGTTDLSTMRFALINGLAALAWGTVFVTLGYLFGQGIEALFGRVKSLEHLLLPFIAVAIVAGGVHWIVRYRRRASVG